MSEYTPSMDEIKRWYAGSVDEYRCDTGMSVEDGEAAFDRATAAHDQALREQIARDIEAFGDSSGVGAYGDYGPPAIAASDASRIARGEGSE